jgi:hypothetical protein
MDLQLAEEALGVGALLVPVYAVVRKSVVNYVWRNESTREYAAVFLSGALFHVLAEASGLNDWYISNGRAQKKWLWRKNNGEPDRSSCPSGVCSLAVRLRDS